MTTRCLPLHSQSMTVSCKKKNNNNKKQIENLRQSTKKITTTITSSSKNLRKLTIPQDTVPEQEQ